MRTNSNTEHEFPLLFLNFFGLDRESCSRQIRHPKVENFKL